ncbi:MAG: creatininase family protein [Ancalomicrobiaceae bacterium]|nr:creatininase family protein [Ancalomicrobiaceae bacterium]
MHRYWIELTTLDAAELPQSTVAILPVAAIEQHGPHLPVGTDAYINRGLITRFLELLPEDVPAVVLPEQSVGASAEHLDFPGSLAQTPARLIDTWTDIIACAARSGLRRFLIFNSHGGQSGFLAHAALDLRVRLSLFVAYASWPDIDYPAGLFAAEELAYGMHGGAIETSLMLHLRPDLVRIDRIADFQPSTSGIEMAARQLSANPGNGRLGGFGWKAQDLQRAGVTGNAAAASAERGQILTDHVAARLVELVSDVGKADEYVTRYTQG